MTRPGTSVIRIRVLLNSLVGERHARRALLEELCDELVTHPRWGHLLTRATALLARLARNDADPSYEAELRAIRDDFDRCASVGPTLALGKHPAAPARSPRVSGSRG